MLRTIPTNSNVALENGRSKKATDAATAIERTVSTSTAKRTNRAVPCGARGS